MALTWTATLKDEISAPAKAAAGALGQLDKELHKTSGDMSKLSSMKLNIKVNSGSIDALKTKTSSLSSDLKTWANDIGGGIGELAGPIGAAAAAAIAATAAIAGLAMKGGEMVFDAARFKDDALDGFKAIVGTDEAAKAAFDRASKTSFEIAGDFKKTMEEMNTLMSQGFSVDMADSIIRAMADVKAMDPKADVEAIAAAFEKIQSQGVLTEKTMKGAALASHVTTDSIAEALAKDLGKTKAQVEQMLKAGKISAAEGEKAILEAVQAKTGKGLGGGAKEANDDVFGMWERMKNLKEQMLGAIDVDWSPLSNAMKTVMDQLQGPAGKELMRDLGEGLQTVIDAIGKVKGEDIATAFHLIGTAAKYAGKYLAILIDEANTIGHAVTIITNGFEGATASFDSFWGGLKESTAGIPVLGGFINDLGGTLSKFGLALLNPMTAMQGMGQALTTLGADLLSSITNGIEEAITGASSEAPKIGSAIIDGIISGIMGGASPLSSAIQSVAKGAIESFTGPDGIDAHSPSKKFYDASTWIPRAVVGAVEDGTPAVQRATERMTDPSRVGFVAGQNIRNSSSTSSRNFTPTVIIHGAAGGPDLMRGVEDTLRSLNAAFS